MRKILLTIILLLICEITTVYGATFSDIKGHWAENVVEKMATNGIINGFEDGTFKPNESVTREQFAKLLVESIELQEIGLATSYDDVEYGRWSSDYIRKVTYYLDTYRIDGKHYFKPTEPTKREDVAVAVIRALGLENRTPNYNLLNKFSDKDKIENQTNVAIAVEYGIMQGKGGYFDPQGNLTRAEVSQLLYNVMEQFVDESDIIKKINNIENWIKIDDENELRIDGRSRKFIIWEANDKRILLLV